MTQNAGILARNVFFVRYKTNEKSNILNDLNLTVPTGSIYCLIGPSGCGKTTFLRCLTGFLRPISGTILLFGKSPGDVSLSIPGVNLGYMPQEISLDNDFTIKEAVNYYARLYRVAIDKAEENLNFLLTSLDLPPSNRVISSLSGGQKRRVSFVCSLIHEPRLTILDEPTVGCDPLVRENMWKILFKMTCEKKTTVIITTHYIEEARRTDCIGFMRKGQILAEASPDEILNYYKVPTLEETFAILCREERSVFRPKVEKVKSDKLVAINTSYASKGVDSVDLSVKDVNKQQVGNNLLSLCTSQLVIQYFLFVAVFSRVFLRFCKMKWYIIGASITIAYIVHLYASIYGVTPKNVKVAVINEEDPPHLSTIVIEQINKNVINLIPYKDMETAYVAAEKKEINGIIHFPKLYSHYALLKYYFREPRDSEKQQYLDNSRVHYMGDSISKIIHQIIELCLTKAIRQAGPLMMINSSLNPTLAIWPITEGEPIYDIVDVNDVTGSKTFFMPVAVFYIAHVTCFLLSIYSLIRDRKVSVLERTYAAGAGPSHILLSHFITNTCIPLLTCGPLWYVVLNYLQAPCKGPFSLVLMLYFVNILSAIPVSFLFAVLKFDQMFIFMLATAYCMVGLATCGILWPLEGLPYFMKSFKYFFPYPEIIQAAIRIMVKGCDFSDAIVQNSLIHSLIFYISTSVLVRIVF